MAKNQDTTTEEVTTVKPAKVTGTGRRGAGGRNANKNKAILPMGLAEMIEKESNDKNEELFMRLIEGDDDSLRFIVINQFGKLFKQEKPKLIFDILENERKIGLFDFTQKYTQEGEKEINNAMHMFVQNRTILNQTQIKDLTIGTVVKANFIMPNTYMKVLKYLEDCGVSTESKLNSNTDLVKMVELIIEESTLFANWDRYLNSDEISDYDKEGFKEEREEKLQSLRNYFLREYIA